LARVSILLGVQIHSAARKCVKLLVRDGVKF
jgi:hypothetical protein